MSKAIKKYPDTHNIPKSEEEGFDLETAFAEFYTKPFADAKDTNEETMVEETPTNEESMAEETPKGEDSNTKELDYYFRSYSNVGIHEEMLRDSQRTLAYRSAILRNKHLFRGKTVLDVGCGTGILSMFAAEAGAKKVIAVDLASITNQAKQIVKENGYEDIIEVVNGKVEEITLSVDTVDIIISEWMGYCLVYESMMDTVLFARDKWLRKDGKGMIFPDKANMYLALIDDQDFADDKQAYWDDVYGIRMSNMKETVMREGFVDEMNKSVVNSHKQVIAKIDLLTVKISELDFASDYDVKITKYNAFNGAMVWFDCEFTHGHQLVVLDTSPFVKYTHWKQTIFYFDKPIYLTKGDRVTGFIALRKNKKNHRHLDVKITAKAQCKTNVGMKTKEVSKVFEMR